jgi:hypothetical protein
MTIDNTLGSCNGHVGQRMVVHSYYYGQNIWQKRL